MSELNDIVAEVATSCRATHARMQARRLSRTYDAALAKHGIRSTEFAVLVAVGRLENGRMGDVAGLLELEQSSLSRAAASLHRKGLIDIAVIGHRTRHLSLSEAGANLIVAAYPDWADAQATTA
ncbi:MarR family winged helix-turn-helix transcriptional regulator [Hasllibacter sp. MH4015]|uniref:MarR family winged helix-turn-helix transcriptional regulator n=1 Tax=Hasllibacter sp. MH4015 TaxID=2854029 RepID=UPI001CD43FC4|nr:MarR family winged helix-turn-helix transcriptional regulator [Hasllibacter sp. MH4015]